MTSKTPYLTIKIFRIGWKKKKYIYIYSFLRGWREQFIGNIRNHVVSLYFFFLHCSCKTKPKVFSLTAPPLQELVWWRSTNNQGLWFFEGQQLVCNSWVWGGQLHALLFGGLVNIYTLNCRVYRWSLGAKCAVSSHSSRHSPCIQHNMFPSRIATSRKHGVL